MYTPNEHFDAAHQRLRHVTSNEVNAGAPPRHPSAPAQSFDAWQHLPQELSSLPTDHGFATQHALSPPAEACGFTDPVNVDSERPTEPWEVDGSALQFMIKIPQHHLPTPPLRSNSLRPLLPPIGHVDSAPPRASQLSYFDQHGLNQSRPVPNGLPLSPEEFLPQTRAYFASNTNLLNTSRAPIWNTDGIGRGLEDWTFYDPSRADFYRQPQLPDYSTLYEAPPVQPPIYQSAPPPSVQPCRASSIASSPTLIHNYGQSPQVLVMQEWRTDNLTKTTKTSRKLPDAATRRKPERLRQKAEARRNTIATGVVEVQTLAYRPLPSSGTPKLKPERPSPAKRRKVTAMVAPDVRRSSQLGPATSTYQSPYDDQGYTGVAINYFQPQTPVCQPSIIKPPPPTADELSQAIVSKYEDYKWSVYHYQLQPKGYDFAERWFQELFDTTLNAEYTERHFSHVSQGFIKDGDRHSILVLHNAANPFVYEPTPSSTITIGMYGYHWYQHNEIHWTTLATDQRHFFVQCVQAGWLVEKYKWTHDAKPTEKRFHRAYWLAANRQDMKGLLNRGPLDDKPHDLVEERGEDDPGKDFSISEAGLTNEWDVTNTESAAAWQRVQDEVEALGFGFDVCGQGWQHVVITNSEW